MIADTMRAAVLIEPRTIDVQEVARPEPQEGEVLVELEGCGVCGSNLPLWQGREWFEYPIAPGKPGHEGWGRVVALGAGVEGLPIASRVAFLSQNAFAEFDVAPARACVLLPAELDALDFPGEPLGCAMNVLLRSGLRPGDFAVVVGSGFFGACLVRIAAALGATVVAVSRRDTSRETALRLGATAALPMEDDGAVVRSIEQETEGRLADVVFEATGTQRALDLASRLCRERGRLVIAGYHQDGLRQVDLGLWNWRGLDVINAHERDTARYVAGIHDAIRATLCSQLDPRELITHRFPLDRAADAFHALEQRPSGFLKAVVTMDGDHDPGGSGAQR